MASKKKKLVATDLLFDWKESPSVEELQAALKPFGIYVIDDPACEGSDSYGFIFTNRPLTKDELDEWRNRQ